MIETFLKENKLWAKTKDLKIWENNPRAITDKDFTRLIIQRLELQQYKPSIITPEGIILGGNMRKKADDFILKMIPKDLVKFFQKHFKSEITIDEAVEIQKKYEKTYVSVVDPSDESTKMKYNLSDNDEAGYTNLDLLSKIYKNYDIDWSAYSINYKPNVNLQEIINQFSQATEDKIPPVSKGTPDSKLGEVYELGNHRLMCGDSINPEHMAKLMGGGMAKVVFTSPPYNMAGKMYENYKDNLKSEGYVKFNINVIKALKPFLKGFLFWNISYNKNARSEFIEIMYKITRETGLKFLELIVWNKGHGMPITSRELMTRQYEDILVVGNEENIELDMELFYLGTTDKKILFNKSTAQALTNYWYIPTNDTQIKNLLACFPVALPFKAIKIMSQPDDIILDPFGGSGTTMIASEQLNRKCCMMELDPRYCDVIRKRYAAFTGQDELWKQKILKSQSTA